MQSFLRHLKWYGHLGKRVEYPLIALLTGSASLQAVYILAGKVPSCVTRRVDAPQAPCHALQIDRVAVNNGLSSGKAHGEATKMIASRIIKDLSPTTCAKSQDRAG